MQNIFQKPTQITCPVSGQRYEYRIDYDAIGQRLFIYASDGVENGLLTIVEIDEGRPCVRINTEDYDEEEMLHISVVDSVTAIVTPGFGVSIECSSKDQTIEEDASWSGKDIMWLCILVVMALIGLLLLV